MTTTTQNTDFSLANYYRERAEEARRMAALYGRCPEDAQKAAGRAEMLAEAERFTRLAEEEEEAQKAAEQADINKEENTMTNNTTNTTETVKTVTDFEIEIMRHNVTPAQFLAYVRQRVDAKGGRWFRGDLDLRWFKASGWDYGYEWGVPGDKGCASEKGVDKPYEKQTYIRYFDGSVYNEIVEFQFDDEKRGTGYYFITNTHAESEDKNQNERIYYKRAAKHIEQKIAENEKKIAKNRETLDRDDLWMTRYERELLKDETRIAEIEIENLRDDLKGFAEALALTEKELTFAEFESLARQNYSRGGAGVVECWDEEQFAEDVKRSGAMTLLRARNVFGLYSADDEQMLAALRDATGEKEEEVEEPKEEKKMNLYNVSFKWSDSVWCANIARAESEEDVRAHYAEYETVYITSATESDLRDAEERHKPIVTCSHIEEKPEEEVGTYRVVAVDGDGSVVKVYCEGLTLGRATQMANAARALWINGKRYDLRVDTAEEELEEIGDEATAEDTVEPIRERIMSKKSRSAWARGVQEYASELLDGLYDAISGGWFDAEDVAAPKLLERQLLNGASSWSEYSWGGCSLIYDPEIAERLGNPSELKKTKNGHRKPNAREEWLDVQARALFQASRLVLEAARAC